jgi:hypothetical protein
MVRTIVSPRFANRNPLRLRGVTVALPAVTFIPRSCRNPDIKNRSLFSVEMIRTCVAEHPADFGYRSAPLRSLQPDAIKKTAEEPGFL